MSSLLSKGPHIHIRNHRKCDELEAKLEQLGILAQQDSAGDAIRTELFETLSGDLTGLHKEGSAANAMPVTTQDVLTWAEEIS